MCITFPVGSEVVTVKTVGMFKESNVTTSGVPLLLLGWTRPCHLHHFLEEDEVSQDNALQKEIGNQETKI